MQMTSYKDFVVLSPATLPSRLGGLATVTRRIGADSTAWKVREVVMPWPASIEPGDVRTIILLD